MRAVVVTFLPLPDPERDRHGVYRRLGMFLHGIGRVCDEIDIVHFGRISQPTSTAAADMSARSSQFWGVPVNVHLAPWNEQQRSWRQAASGPFTLRYRGDFRPYLGTDQAGALGRSLDEAQPAMIFAHRLPAMIALMQLPRILAPIFFDLDDVEHQVKWRAVQTATSPLQMMRHALEVPALLAAERRSVVRAASTFVCSSVDRTILSAMHFDISRVLVVPNALEIPELRAGLKPNRSVLFLGNYGYPPNAEAAERLINRIWPKIHAGAESSSLIIAGDHPERIPSYRSQPANIVFTGFVDDLEALYRQARIVCCPIMNGGGTRLKLIEAAGHGKPIAATSMAVEGLEFRNGRDVLVDDDDDALALACLRLLQDDSLADALANSAYRKARLLYSIVDRPDQIAHQLSIGLARHVIEGGQQAASQDRVNRPIGCRTASGASGESC